MSLQEHAAQLQARTPDSVPDDKRTAVAEFVLAPGDHFGVRRDKEITIKVGQYVLLHNEINPSIPHVGQIEKLWTSPAGGRVVTYTKFFRPEETFHVPTRSFFQNEVLKNIDLISQPADQVMRHCCVLHLRDYLRLQPVGIAPEDTFVCESKYTPKGKNIKPIKPW